MPISLRIRNVPDELRAVLSSRAERESMSLRRYVLRVLAEHAALPADDEWLHSKPGTTPDAPILITEPRKAAGEAGDEGEP